MVNDRPSRPLARTLLGHAPASVHPQAPQPRPRGARRRLSGPITGPQIRKDIEDAAPAFLEPHRYEPEEAFRALIIVMHSYALGSRTASRLMVERHERDERWTVPTRKEAFVVVTNAAVMRQYLPHLLGNVMAAPAAVQ